MTALPAQPGHSRSPVPSSAVPGPGGGSLSSIKVAIFHDFMEVPGGGERAMLTLAQALDAPIYTARLNPAVPGLLGFPRARVEGLGSPSHRHPWKQIKASFLFSRARRPGYDAYVLSGNWAHYAAPHHHPNLLYCHTPPRFFYDLRDRFLGYLPRWKRPAARLWIGLHGGWDRRSIRSVDSVVVNSENVRRRVKRYYGREARVVHPPVPTSRYRFHSLGDFWLSVNRLYPEKRLELQMEIFRRLPRERLLVVGENLPGDHSSGYASTLDPPPNVEFRGTVDQEELIHLYATCRGLIATAVDEDFGMTPVEAMASGKATLAVDEGGFRETVQQGATGFLLPPSPQAFVDAIRKLDQATLEAMRPACEEAARAFDEGRFLEGMREEVEALLKRVK